MSLETYRYDAYNCARCSNCKWMDHVYMKSYRFAKVCPSSARYLFDAYSAQGRMDIATVLLDKELRLDPKVLDVIYKCTLCGACDTMCKRNIDLEILDTLKELRAFCFEERKILPQYNSLVNSIAVNDNPWSKPRDTKTKWMEDFNVKDIYQEKADVLFFAGCFVDATNLYRLPQTSIKILRSAGVDVGILGNKEKCCGSLAYEVGDRDVSINLIKQNIETFNRLGFEKLVTSCAMCYGMFKSVYPAWGKVDFDVLHIVEYIDQLIKGGKLKFKEKVDLKVTYHDPCNLGRKSEPYIHWEGERREFGRLDPPKEFRRGTLGVYEPPRDVLRAIPGVELIEMERIKENAWCCGAGGGVKMAYEDFALWTAQERLEEVKATGVNSLVTCCPHCEQNFTEAVNRDKEKIEIYDLVDIVWQATNGKEA